MLLPESSVNSLKKRRPMRGKIGKILLGLIISAVSLWLAVRGMLGSPGAWTKIVTAFREADYRSLPIILLVLAIFYWLKAVRWKLLLTPVGKFRPGRDLLGPIMIGFGFNNLLPLRIGELLRCHAFARQQHLPLTVALSSVVLERILDGMSVVFYLSIGLLFVEGLDPRVQQAASVFSMAAAVIVAVSLIYVIWTKPFVLLVERILIRVPFIPSRLAARFCSILESGAKGLSSLKDPRLVFLMLILSLIKWGLNGFLVLLSLWSFNLPHTIPIGMVLMGAIAFGVAVPSSPGYVGVMQLVFISVMQFFTPDQESILAASFYYQLTQWVPVTLIGLIYGGIFLWQGNLNDLEPLT